MDKYSKIIFMTVLILILTFAVFQTPLSSYAYALEGSQISSIEIPTKPSISSVNTAGIYEFHLSGFKISKLAEKYVTISFNGLTSYIPIPGAPAIPFKAYIVRIPGYADKAGISVIVDAYSYKVLDLGRKIAPVAKPLPYMPEKEFKLVFEEDAKIYGKSEYYPGKLLSYYIGYGNGETVVVVWLYPIQYNPVSNKIILFDYVRFKVLYGSIKRYEASSQSPELIIITSSELANLTKTLADFYSDKLGIKAEIVTTDWIYKNYKPAENITAYPGFYNPITMGGVIIPKAASAKLYQHDYVYATLVRSYNWTLALKIVSYLRDTKAHPNLKYITIIGDARTVPPSFYYQAILLYRYMGPWNGWIPTDFFYASPDYDLIPNYGVGRIPFSNPVIVSSIISKIIKWHMETLEKPDWTRKLVMTGGYPFGFMFMFGETAISSITRSGYTSMFKTIHMTRTNENYDNKTVQDLFAHGKAIWWFILSHGMGNAIGDYKVTKTGFEFETLANTSFILSLLPNARVPIVASVACMDASWDDALVKTMWFTPPSFGEAILLSRGAGIAYIGSARVAWELIPTAPTFIKGSINVVFRGASWIHAQFINAYNSFMGKTDRVGLGLVYALGLTKYFATTSPLFKKGFEYVDIAFTTIFETVLLGDAALELPVFKEPYSTANVSSVEPLKYDALLDAKVFSREFVGNISFYSIIHPGVTSITGTSDIYNITLVRVFYYPGWGALRYYFTVCKTSVKAVKGKAIYNASFDRNASGLILMKVSAGNIEYRFYLTAAGIKFKPAFAEPGTIIKLEGMGLDLISPAYYGIYRSMYLYVAGRFIASVTPDDAGYIYWEFSLPNLKGGLYDIRLIPVYVTPETEDIIKYIKASIPVFEVKSINVVASIGSLYEPGEDVVVRVLTLLDGKLVNTSIKAYLITPSGVTELKYTIIKPGEYLITFKAPSKEGTYTIYITASYGGMTIPLKKSSSEAPSKVPVKIAYVAAHGEVVKSVRVVTAFKRIESEISKSTEELSGKLGDAVKTLTSQLSKSVDTITSRISDSTKKIMTDLTNIYNSLNLSITLDSAIGIITLILIAIVLAKVLRIK